MSAASAWAQTYAGCGTASGIVTQASAGGMPDATVVLSNPTPGAAVITTLASGQPVTPPVMVEGQQFSAITMDYTSSLNGSGDWCRVPFDAVNSLTTGSEY